MLLAWCNRNHSLDDVGKRMSANGATLGDLISRLRETPIASHSGLSEEDLVELARGLVPFLHEVLHEKLAPLEARIAELEATALRDGDVWETGEILQDKRPDDV